MKQHGLETGEPSSSFQLLSKKIQPASGQFEGTPQIMRIDPFSSKIIRLMICIVPALFITVSCATRGDVRNAKTDLDTVRGNLEGLGSNIEKRQAGMSEEIQNIKKNLNSLKERDEEFRQAFSHIQQKMNINKIETDENLRHLTGLTREYQKALEKNLMILSDRISKIDARLTDLRRKIDEVDASEKDQQRQLKDTANRLGVFLDEVNNENSRLKEGILDLSRNYNQLADKINTHNRKLADEINNISREFSGRIRTLETKVNAVQKNLAGSTGRYHVVAEGDTLSSIASKYGVSVDKLVQINSLDNPDDLRIGQKITLTSP